MQSAKIVKLYFHPTKPIDKFVPHTFIKRSDAFCHCYRAQCVRMQINLTDECVKGSFSVNDDVRTGRIALIVSIGWSVIVMYVRLADINFTNNFVVWCAHGASSIVLCNSQLSLSYVHSESIASDDFSANFAKIPFPCICIEYMYVCGSYLNMQAFIECRTVLSN